MQASRLWTGQCNPTAQSRHGNKKLSKKQARLYAMTCSISSKQLGQPTSHEATTQRRGSLHPTHSKRTTRIEIPMMRNEQTSLGSKFGGTADEGAHGASDRDDIGPSQYPISLEGQEGAYQEGPRSLDDLNPNESQDLQAQDEECEGDDETGVEFIDMFPNRAVVHLDPVSASQTDRQDQFDFIKMLVDKLAASDVDEQDHEAVATRTRTVSRSQNLWAPRLGRDFPRASMCMICQSSMDIEDQQVPMIKRNTNRHPHIYSRAAPPTQYPEGPRQSRCMLCMSNLEIGDDYVPTLGKSSRRLEHFHFCQDIPVGQNSPVADLAPEYSKHNKKRKSAPKPLALNHRRSHVQV